MELESRVNKQDWIEFGNPPNEMARQFMMENFGCCIGRVQAHPPNLLLFRIIRFFQNDSM